MNSLLMRLTPAEISMISHPKEKKMSLQFVLAKEHLSPQRGGTCCLGLWPGRQEAKGQWWGPNHVQQGPPQEWGKCVPPIPTPLLAWLPMGSPTTWLNPPPITHQSGTINYSRARLPVCPAITAITLCGSSKSRFLSIPSSTK